MTGCLASPHGSAMGLPSLSCSTHGSARHSSDQIRLKKIAIPIQRHHGCITIQARTGQPCSSSRPAMAKVGAQVQRRRIGRLEPCQRLDSDSLHGWGQRGGKLSREPHCKVVPECLSVAGREGYRRLQRGRPAERLPAINPDVVYLCGIGQKASVRSGLPPSS
jgi:hypothetical protein